jgi:hypothetical protein
MIDAIFTTETTGFLRKYNGCSRMNCAKVEFDLKNCVVTKLNSIKKFLAKLCRADLHRS